MKVVKYSTDIERTILVAAIVDDKVCGFISQAWERGDRFESKYANVVMYLCHLYYEDHRKAPEQDIASQFAIWEEKKQEAAVCKDVERFLEFLSDQAEQTSKINPDYVIKRAKEVFLKTHVIKVSEEACDLARAGKILDGAETLSKFSSKPIVEEQITHLFVDEEEAKQSVRYEESEILIKLPGALGEFFQDSLSKDSFVAFAGMEKRGKSYWLMELAYRAMLQRQKVVYFQVGDMSKKQIKRRLMIRNSRHPYKIPSCGYIAKPIKLEIIHQVGKEEFHVEHENKVFKEPLDEIKAWEECKKTMRDRVKAKDSYFALSVHANGTVNVNFLRSVLKRLESENYTPSVIVIDYADILAPLNNKLDKRDQINETWSALRTLSQETHTLVLTATQVNRQGYKAPTLRLEHSSDDKRKAAHVTAYVGINQTDTEKESGVYRLNIMAAREMEFSPSRCVYTAGCLAIANPCLLSSWPQ